MSTNETILGSIDPEIADRLLTRRDAIKKGAAVSSTVAAGLALASVPVALAALSQDAFAQTPADVTATLNFALKLEIFENEFYKAVLGTSSSSAQNNAFATVRAAAQAVPGAVAALAQIQKHEAAHVQFLTANGAVNDLNLTADSFDFTGNRGNATPGPFARATTELPFLLLVAQGAEDTGVRAYKGQAGFLINNKPVLEAALRIHSVEARHAAKIRRMRRAAAGAPDVIRYSGTVRGAGASAIGAGGINPAPPQGAVDALTAIYAGEDVTTQANVSITGLPDLPSGFDANAASEAFDEPLTKAQVVAIVQPFFKPTLT
jgi:hypothetical protein